MIRLEKVTEAQRTLLYNLNQKYLYEMTNFYDDPLDEDGNLHYGWFDAYFTDSRRTALLIHDDDALVGFAMLCPYSYFDEAPDHVLAEFTIFPMYRGRRLATRAARAIFEGFPGRWEVKYNIKNAPAKGLWTKVTAPFTPEMRPYNEDETVLCFDTGGKGED